MVHRHSDIHTGIHRCARGAAPGRRPRTPLSCPSPARRRRPHWPRRRCSPRRCPQARGASAPQRRRTWRRLPSSPRSCGSSRWRGGPWAARRRWVQHGSRRGRATGASSASCARAPRSWAPARRPPVPYLSCLSFSCCTSRSGPVFSPSPSPLYRGGGGGETWSAGTHWR